MLAKREQITFKIINPANVQDHPTLKDLRGDYIVNICNKCQRIIDYQFSKGIKKGIKGFLFHGNVGVGKTTLAKVLAKETNSKLLFIDGSDIAKAKYGQSEQELKHMFEEALNHDQLIILFDDVESIFMARGATYVREWHFAQNSVFFHKVDELDTSKNFLILTTNRFDLLDHAITDRFLCIEFPIPNTKILIEIAKFKCSNFDLPPNVVQKVTERILNDCCESVRGVENIVIEEFVRYVTS